MAKRPAAAAAAKKRRIPVPVTDAVFYALKETADRHDCRVSELVEAVVNQYVAERSAEAFRRG